LGLKSSASSRPESRSGASRPLSSSRSRPISSSSSSLSRPASRGVNMPGADFLDGGRRADANSSPLPNQPKFKPSYVHEVGAKPHKSPCQSKTYRLRACTRSEVPYFSAAISFLYSWPGRVSSFRHPSYKANPIRGLHEAWQQFLTAAFIRFFHVQVPQRTDPKSVPLSVRRQQLANLEGSPSQARPSSSAGRRAAASNAGAEAGAGASTRLGTGGGNSRESTRLKVSYPPENHQL
jgi:hypothetical protein